MDERLIASNVPSGIAAITFIYIEHLK